MLRHFLRRHAPDEVAQPGLKALERSLGYVYGLGFEGLGLKV